MHARAMWPGSARGGGRGGRGGGGGVWGTWGVGALGGGARRGEAGPRGALPWDAAAINSASSAPAPAGRPAPAARTAPAAPTSSLAQELLGSPSPPPAGVLTRAGGTAPSARFGRPPLPPAPSTRAAAAFGAAGARQALAEELLGSPGRTAPPEAMVEQEHAPAAAAAAWPSFALAKKQAPPQPLQAWPQAQAWPSQVQPAQQQQRPAPLPTPPPAPMPPGNSLRERRQRLRAAEAQKQKQPLEGGAPAREQKRRRLAEALGLAGGSGSGPSGGGNGSARRQLASLDFLEPGRRRDARGVLEGTPGYDARTLMVPDEFIRSQSDTQKQWWRIKSQHADCVLLFKIGKFYELFETDADIGVSVCALKMQAPNAKYSIAFKGKKCGFPERAFAEKAVRLVASGRRVAVVEQMRREAGTAASSKTMARQTVAILSAGTLIEPELQRLLEPSAPMAILTLALSRGSAAFMTTDCYSGTTDVRCVQADRGAPLDFSDWKHALESIVAITPPAEVVIPQGLDPAYRRTLEVCCNRAMADRTEGLLVTEMALPVADNAARASACANRYWAGAEGSTAEAIKRLHALLVHPGGGECAATTGAALLLLFEYLAEARLTRQILPRLRVTFDCAAMARPTHTPPAEDLPDSASTNIVQQADRGGMMLIDRAAVTNLELVVNVTGGKDGTLLKELSACSTAAGNRELRAWMLSPLSSPAQIDSRQRAVRLLSEDAEVFAAAVVAQSLLAEVPDLARATCAVQRHAPPPCDFKGLGEHGIGCNRRHAPGVLLYETVDEAAEATRAMVSALTACRGALKAAAAFDGVRQRLVSAAPVLDALTRQGSACFPPIERRLERLEAYIELDENDVPAVREGADPALEAAMRDVKSAENALDEVFLPAATRQMALLNPTSSGTLVAYTGSYALAVPNGLVVPPDWEPATELGKKGKGKARLYTCAALRALLKAGAQADEDKRAALVSVLTRTALDFCDVSAAWLAVAKATAELDALISLARAARAMAAGGPICYPSVDPPARSRAAPLFEARSLRHPTLASCSSALDADGASDTVSSDVRLGGADRRLLILSGPNMGGKSTLMRAIASSTILAQMGAAVPAESLRLTAATRMFVRMGAQDSIIEGQSTFMTEMRETATSVCEARPSDVVILDEVGRGTSTRDGAALAASVAAALGKKGCLAVVSTHYGEVSAPDGLLARGVAEHATYAHMGYRAHGAPGADTPQSIEFTYRLTPGPASNSMGVAVGGLAGLPASVLANAQRIALSAAAEREEERGNAPRAVVMDRAPAAAVTAARNVLRMLRCTSASNTAELRAEWRALLLTSSY